LLSRSRPRSRLRARTTSMFSTRVVPEARRTHPPEEERSMARPEPLAARRRAAAARHRRAARTGLQAPPMRAGRSSMAAGTPAARHPVPEAPREPVGKPTPQRRRAVPRRSCAASRVWGETHPPRVATRVPARPVRSRTRRRPCVRAALARPSRARVDLPIATPAEATAAKSTRRPTRGIAADARTIAGSRTARCACRPCVAARTAISVAPGRP
jgi:hypothetical protein